MASEVTLRERGGGLFYSGIRGDTAKRRALRLGCSKQLEKWTGVAGKAPNGG